MKSADQRRVKYFEKELWIGECGTKPPVRSRGSHWLVV